MKRLTDVELIDELQKRFTENMQALETANELNRQLQEVNKKLEESEALKSHFISNITNEIINPFASILGLSSSIVDATEADFEQIKSMAQLIYSEAFNLDFQLKNIFAVAEVEAGTCNIELAHVDIKALIERAVDLFSKEIDKKRLKVTLDIVTEVEGGGFVFSTDAEKFNLVFLNLLSNAIKFSKPKQDVFVCATIKTDELMICVHDNGLGISTEAQQYIFDRFKQVDESINSVNTGHGLGLSLVKALLDMLDGAVTVKSEKNEGARFTVHIPAPVPGTKINEIADDDNEFFFGSEEAF